MSYLNQLVVAYSDALTADTGRGSLAEARSALATANSASERGRALAAIAHALVHQSAIPCFPLRVLKL